MIRKTTVIATVDEDPTKLIERVYFRDWRKKKTYVGVGWPNLDKVECIGPARGDLEAQAKEHCKKVLRKRPGLISTDRGPLRLSA